MQRLPRVSRPRETAMRHEADLERRAEVAEWPKADILGHDVGYTGIPLTVTVTMGSLLIGERYL
jgi:hypothetical protein